MRRIAEAQQLYPQIDKPHRIRRTDFVRDAVASAYRLQRLRAGDNGIVVLLCDADDDEHDDIEAQILRALEPIDEAPLVVAVAVREFEAWFLAALPSLRTHSRIHDDADAVPDPEGPRNAKKVLEQRMTESYSETIHQAAFNLDPPSGFGERRPEGS